MGSSSRDRSPSPGAQSGRRGSVPVEEAQAPMVMRPVLVVMAPLIALWEYLCELLIWFFYLKGFRVGCFDLTYPDGTQELYGDPTRVDTWAQPGNRANLRS